MKLLVVLLLLVSCASCPERIYKKCISWTTEMYFTFHGRGSPYMTHRDVCEEYSSEVLVDYNCKTYKLGEECE